MALINRNTAERYHTVMALADLIQLCHKYYLSRPFLTSSKTIIEVDMQSLSDTLPIQAQLPAGVA